MEQNSPEWLEWRRKGIGASDVAALIGLSKWSTPYKVWADKVGQGTQFVGNFATERGQELEGKARARYELVTMEDMPPALAIHPKYDICRVSLDGLSADGKKILEIKVPSQASHDIADKEKRVPDQYVPQVQYQLAVTGAEELDYFSYHAPTDTHALVPVKPDVEYQGMLIASVVEFWNKYVLTNTPPPLTDDDDKLVTEGEVMELAKRLVDGKDRLSKAEQDQLKRLIIQGGGHSRIRAGRALVTRSVAASGKETFRLTVAKVGA